MRSLILVISLSAVAVPMNVVSAEVETGFVSMFNGVDLTGWDGKPGLWRVEDGAISSESTPETPCERAHYLYWQNGEPGDFILRFEYKLIGEGGNSGVHFRSEKRPDFDTWGYQADIESGAQWSGCLFQHDRGGVVMRGFKAEIDARGQRKEVPFASPDALQSHIKANDWNSYEVRAEGNHISLSINGQLMCEVKDDDAKYSRDKGFISLQMHPGPPMKIQFRNLRIKPLKK